MREHFYEKISFELQANAIGKPGYNHTTDYYVKGKQKENENKKGGL